MGRQDLCRLSVKELCQLAGINYDLYKKAGFDKEILVEIILTPNN